MFHKETLSCGCSASIDRPSAKQFPSFADRERVRQFARQMCIHAPKAHT